MANEEPGAIPEAELEKDIEVAKVEDVSKLTPEQVDALIKQRDTLAAQKKHWKGKAIDPATGKPYRDILSARQESPANLTPPKPADVQLEGRVAKMETLEEKRDFGYRHKLSPEAVDNVFSYAQGRGKKPDEVLSDPFVKSGLSALQSQERTRNNVPGPSHRLATVEGKSFGQMSKDERRANFSKVTGASRE